MNRHQYKILTGIAMSKINEKHIINNRNRPTPNKYQSIEWNIDSKPLYLPQMIINKP